MYRIIISPRAKQELKKIEKLYRQAAAEAIDEIKENPFSGKPLTRELTGKFSYKISVFRIIYKINKKDKNISILTAGHRSIVYN